MKTVTFATLAVAAATVGSMHISERATGGYLQNPSGSASFTMYTGCGSPGEDIGPCARGIA
jgi:hypothetical protein